MEKDFISIVKYRRSIYDISESDTIENEVIERIIAFALKHTPSAFNSQSGRMLLLFGSHHRRLWDIVKNVLRKNISEDRFTKTEKKIDSFRSGHGSILFFEDMDVLRGLQERFPLYKENFPVWSLQSSGMMQYVVWTALESEGLGANLQHYNPLIDDYVKIEWNIPESWQLLSQMPFGLPNTPPSEKEFLPIDGRMKVFG